MGFTYEASNPTNRDKLRLLIGDTNQDEHIFEDEELDIFLNLENNDLNMVAATCCRSIAISQAKQAVAVRTTGWIDPGS